MANPRGPTSSRILLLLASFSFVTATLAGCAQAGDGPADLDVAGGADILALVGLDTAAIVSSGKDHIVWHGAELEGLPAFDDPGFLLSPWLEPEDCVDRPCDWTQINVAEPIEGPMVITIEWEGQDEDWGGPLNYLGNTRVSMDLAVYQNDRLVVDGSESSHYASVAVIDDPSPGVYDVRVVGRTGTGSYYGAVTFGEAAWKQPMAATGDVHPGEALPDLVMLPPDHIQVSTPIPRQTEPVNAVTNPGCGPDESAEDQHRRCLRFAGILGNEGNGPFELRMPVEDGLGGPTGGSEWQQVIYDDAGQEARRVSAGPADYHPVHGHFHLRALVDTQLYPYDQETGTRGDPIGPGQKTGFCIIDGGLIDPRLPGATPYAYNGNGCCYYVGFCQLDASRQDEFIMGMTEGWYDIYPWYRADQYLEITGVEDGVYELVSVINADQQLLELDPFNNEASTVIRITGNDVEMLEQRTQAGVGPHPDADWGYDGKQDG